MPLPKFPPHIGEWLPGRPFEEPPLPAFLRQETMFFNVPEAREHLISQGFVYTLRPKMRKTGHDAAVYGSYFRQQRIGDVWVDFIKEVEDIDEVREYLPGSGFKRVEDWWQAAKGSRFLFKVRRI